jgi:hypothetical protein
MTMSSKVMGTVILPNVTVALTATTIAGIAASIPRRTKEDGKHEDLQDPRQAWPHHDSFRHS